MPTHPITELSTFWCNFFVLFLNPASQALNSICRYLLKAGVPLASAQVQYSLLSRGPEQLATREICRELGITLIAYSPLGLGALPLAYALANVG